MLPMATSKVQQQFPLWDFFAMTDVLQFGPFEGITAMHSVEFLCYDRCYLE